MKKLPKRLELFFAETSLLKRPVPAVNRSNFSGRKDQEVEPFDRIAGIEWNGLHEMGRMKWVEKN